MAKNIITRAWDAVKLPTVQGTKKPVSPQRRKQRRMIFGTLTVIALGLIGWAIYAYMGTAQQRAQAAFDDAQRLMTRGITRKPSTVLRALCPSGRRWRTPTSSAASRITFCPKTIWRWPIWIARLRLDPNLPDAYAATGSISRDHGDVSHAMEEYTRSIRTSPNVEAFFERGQLYEKLGDHQKAIADYDEAIAYLRDAPHVYRARAFAKSNMGDEAGAKADRDKAHALEHP